MDSVAGIVKKIWDIKAPTKTVYKGQTEAEAEADYQKALKKYQDEQAAGITRKMAFLAPQDWKPERSEPDRFDESRGFTTKIHKDEVAKVGDRVLVSGEKYELNGKLGFQANPKIEVLVAAKR